MERITIYPDKKLRKKLDEEANKQRRSLNNLILLIVSSYFEKNKGG